MRHPDTYREVEDDELIKFWYGPDAKPGVRDQTQLTVFQGIWRELRILNNQIYRFFDRERRR